MNVLSFMYYLLFDVLFFINIAFKSLIPFIGNQNSYINSLIIIVIQVDLLTI